MTDFLPIHETIPAPPRQYDGAIGALLFVIALILLASGPALVILIWKAAL